jgi:hypothetical protein
VTSLFARLRRFAHLLAGLVIMLRAGPAHQAVTAGRYIGPILVHTVLVACSCGHVFYTDGSRLAQVGLEVFTQPARPRARRRRGVL